MTRAAPSDCFARQPVRTGLWVVLGVITAFSGSSDEVQVATQRAEDIILLHAGKPIERELSGGEAHTYQLPLKAGEYARMTVEQRGIDVFVQLLGEDGGVIADFQDEIRTRGEERVRKLAPPRGHDLGPAEAIDAAVDALRQALRDPKRTDLKQLARAVDERVMQPIRPWLGDATRLLISPDGELNLIPFEALQDQLHRYLVERYAISYLTSGRDLLRMQVPRASKSEPVIIADPLFGEPPTAKEGQQKLASTRTRRRSVTTGEDLSSVYFAPLAGTAQEARAMQDAGGSIGGIRSTGPASFKPASGRISMGNVTADFTRM